MEEGTEKQNRSDRQDRDEIFSKSVRAGKRTYFFDVRATLNGDYYLTITESKKRIDDNGKFSFEKHKVFLYKEDFNKFVEGLTDSIEHIKSISSEEIVERVPRVYEDKPAIESSETAAPAAETKESSNSNSFSDVNFEDLDK